MDKLKSNISLKKIHITIILFGIFFISLSIFHTNLWIDEAFSVGFANQTMGNIWKIGGHDVHPVLYYWMLRIINLLTNGSIVAYRLFSALPIALLGLLGYTHIRKDFCEKTGMIFSFLCYFVPIMAVNANMIRMYSWAIYIVTIFAIYAYRIYLGENSKKNWIIFGIFSLASIYIHYYGLMAAGIINVFLLIYFIKNKRWKELKWQILFGIIQAVLYLPWIIYLAAQMKHVSGGFWIPFELPKVLIELIGCQMSGIMDFWIGFIFNILLFIALAIIVFRKRNDKLINWKPLKFSIEIYLTVILAALIISKLLNTSILYYRYLFVITGLYIFAISYILSKEDNIYFVCVICGIIYILGLTNTAIQIKENYSQSNGKQIEYLKNNILEDDVIVYNNIDRGSIIAVNFPDNKQYFYNPQNWAVIKTCKIWAPQMEAYITTDFLEKCKGRIWIVGSKYDGLYNYMFKNKDFKWIKAKLIETEYHDYTYDIKLIERIKK